MKDGRSFHVCVYVNDDNVIANSVCNIRILLYHLGAL